MTDGSPESSSGPLRPPQEMRLRSSRAPVTRLSRKVLIGLGGVAMAAPAVMHAPAHAPAAAPAAEAPKPSGPNPGAVPSPMVGTVYVSPEPGKPPFVTVGSTVKEGDTLMIVEAMKTMNPITAPKGGKVSEICIENGQPVEFGQTLLILA